MISSIVFLTDPPFFLPHLSLLLSFFFGGFGCVTFFVGCALADESAMAAHVRGRTCLVPCLAGGSGSGFDWEGGARTLSADFALRVLCLFGAPSSVERARLLEVGFTDACASALACAFALLIGPALALALAFGPAFALGLPL